MFEGIDTFLYDLMRKSKKIEKSRSAMNKKPGVSAQDRPSKFRGVHWDRTKNKWAACAKVDGRTKHLGHYAQEVDAARKYDETAADPPPSPNHSR